MATIFVLTGGPCAGKTTLLEALRAREYPVIPEAATAVILEGKLHPATAPIEFQREVLRRQIQAEGAAPAGPVFADRAVGDHFGYLDYYRTHRGIDRFGEFDDELAHAWNEALARYPAVFLLEPRPGFVPATYRRENWREALHIHECLARAYRTRHPRVIDVPWDTIESRVEAVLAAVRQGS